MSGKGSRTRRVDATRRAYEDVYKLRGAEIPPPPFGNERQDRIYAQQYKRYRRSYWHMKRMDAELSENEMSNMSYCRFENTLADLRDCRDALAEMSDYEKELSDSEARCAKKLLRLCRDLADDYDPEA